ncbi:hypothetical protein BGZ51_001760 [Haplosporangium sp. Z 767]|nr:hypothetical protein BGZ50_005590 [Haplosporangium sp. Z 11]KAF9186787.1 hypothetical protein BGZ51_001760 [Haplosporangium sp. Z 767]
MAIIDERDDISSHHPTHGRTDTAAISKPTRANADLLTSSSTSSGTTTTAVSDTHPQSEPEQHQHQQHENMNTFLASAEARHILDMPSLLGKDPNMIPDVLAMPIPVQPRRSKAARSSSSSSAAAVATSSGTNTTPGSQLISELDAKAESAAKAMTKRYAAKNLNMTETEAHRMVQIMAAEIVTLHEERDVMLQKMEKAKREMLEAAKLLRMKVNAEKSSVEEFQDMSAEDKGQLSGTEGSHTMRVKNVEDNGEASDKKTHDASVYDKDEWRDRE